MTVIDKRTQRTNANFDEINLGETFIDEDGDICIKIDDSHALYYDFAGNIWDVITMYDSDKILLVQATLTIEDM